MVPEEENDGLLDAERHQARHTIAPRAQLFPALCAWKSRRTVRAT